MWWRVNKKKFLVLTKVARDVLAIPLTSIAFESAFSIDSRIVDHFWSSLTPKQWKLLFVVRIG
jgi:hypothetical protein